MCISPVSLPMNSAQRRSTAAAVSRSVRPTRSIARACRDRRQQRGGLRPLVRRRHAPRSGRRRTARRRLSAAAPARQIARRAIACRASSRRVRSPAPAAPAAAAPSAARSCAGAVHRRGAGGGSRSNRRASWRTRCSRGSPFAMTRRSPARNSQASAEPRRSTTRSQRRRATRAKSGSQCSAQGRFVDGYDAFKPGHRRKQRRGERSGGDGQPCARMALDEMRQQPGRQYGIADPGRGHEKDVHRRNSLRCSFAFLPVLHDSSQWIVRSHQAGSKSGRASDGGPRTTAPGARESSAPASR